MKLYFVDPDAAHKMGHRVLDQNPTGLIAIASVIVFVGEDDVWMLMRDRHGKALGQSVQPHRRAQLLERYYTVSRQH